MANLKCGYCGMEIEISFPYSNDGRIWVVTCNNCGKQIREEEKT